MFLLLLLAAFACVISSLTVPTTTLWKRIMSSTGAAKFNDLAPSWSDIDTLLRQKETVAERVDFEDQQIGRGSANAMANLRLFELPESLEPDVVLYRDSAAW
jgi:hypothetical protein